MILLVVICQVIKRCDLQTDILWFKIKMLSVNRDFNLMTAATGSVIIPQLYLLIMS